MNTTDFASEMGTDSRTARKFLRSITPKDEQPGKGSRWDLPETKRELNKLRKQFTSWTDAQAEKAEPTDEAADPIEVPVDDEVTDEV